MWRVVLLNDDYTPMEFVVQLLESVFDKSPAEAYRIMMQVHVDGRGSAASIRSTSPKRASQTESRRERGFRARRHGVVRSKPARWNAE